MDAERILTLDALLFFDGRPAELELYERFAQRAVGLFPETEIRTQKTQISFCDPRMYACVSLMPVRRKAERPPRFITVTFGLCAPVESPRAVCVRVRPNRWTHHVIVGEPAEIDDELMGWVALSHG